MRYFTVFAQNLRFNPVQQPRFEFVLQPGGWLVVEFPNRFIESLSVAWPMYHFNTLRGLSGSSTLDQILLLSINQKQTST